MKHLIIALAALTTLTASAQIGVDAIAKQRARDVANQNNNRSMQPPTAASQPRPAQPAAAAATPMTASQQAYANFQSQLFAVNANTATNLKPMLAKDMANVAQGAKPSQPTLDKLSDHLTTALGEAKLSTSQKTRLAQNVGVLLNSANTAPTQKEAMIKDVQSILEKGGVSTENAAAVAADLKSVTDEIKPK
jgi:hypothetical protein